MLLKPFNSDDDCPKRKTFSITSIDYFAKYFEPTQILAENRRVGKNSVHFTLIVYIYTRTTRSTFSRAQDL